ncbi:MAG: M50 family metallopeptidase [Acidobacteriota bacterium]
MTRATRTRLVLLVCVVATAIVHLAPDAGFLAYPLLLLSSLAHELGHGVAALLVGGRFHRLLLWADGSGIAELSIVQSGPRLAFVAAGGLVGPALVAAAAFAAGRSTRGARGALGVAALVLGIALLLVVRTPFGIVFVSLLCIALLAAWRWASPDLAQLLVVFLGVELTLSVFARADYLFTPVARTAQGTMPSDVAQISAALAGPYWFWGALCAAFSLAVLALGLRSYLRS